MCVCVDVEGDAGEPPLQVREVGALRPPQRLDDARLRVVIASHDGFVPRPATESLYEAVAVVNDDHPLCGRAARDAIAGASAELLSEPLLGAPT